MTLTAHAKLNLFLHITGKRADGYHQLQSLAVFTQFGDEVEIAADTELSLQVAGEFSSLLPPAGEDNLVLRAARLLQKNTNTMQGAKITLHKKIPVGAGLGGGSSDAGCVLRGLAKLWNVPLDVPAFELLGSDIPVCIAGKSAWMEGVGEKISPVDIQSPVWVVLANPRLPLLTADVYRAYAAPFAAHVVMPQRFDFDSLIDYLAPLHNALETPALALMPQIGDVLGALKGTEHCALARMSGSGATCFGLYADENSARKAAEKILETHPGWWCVATKLEGEYGKA